MTASPFQISLMKRIEFFMQIVRILASQFKISYLLV